MKNLSIIVMNIAVIFIIILIPAVVEITGVKTASKNKLEWMATRL